jgi:saccharopine dehydrogenase-like NADP-dependent oxidoreductase
MHYAVFGAGRQGTASAYELIVHGDASAVALLDKDEGAATTAASRVNELTETRIAEGRKIDVKDRKEVEKALEDADGRRCR